MKVTELSGGTTTTLRLAWVDDAPSPLPQAEDEVLLTWSDGKVLLAHRRDQIEVDASTKADRQQLLDVVTGDRPFVTFVAKATQELLVLEARAFLREPQITTKIEIGIDDKIVDDLQRVHNVPPRIADAARWLEDRLLLPPDGRDTKGHRRFVIADDSSGRMDAFRICGNRIAVDVSRTGDKLRIERIVKGGSRDATRHCLVHAQVAIVDATVAGLLQAEARVQLAAAVGQGGSYLRLWQKYHGVEKQQLWRRVTVFGFFAYSARERRPDGGWSFHLENADELEKRLAQFNPDGLELEAGPTPPRTDDQDEDPGRRHNREVPCYSAPFRSVDPRTGILELEALADDDTRNQTPPHEPGFVYLSYRGDKVRLQRRERAEEALRTGNCPLPQLGLLMEGKAVGQIVRRNPHSIDGPKLAKVVREAFGDGRPTPRQKQAIELALNTPDVCLIQGPPGTGKTQVINAIARCLAELADEGLEHSHRVLVTAAQQDARDNLARRTTVFGLPAVTVGHRRRPTDTQIDTVETFRRDRIEALRARHRDVPETERLTRARLLAVGCLRSRPTPAEEAAQLGELRQLLEGLAPPALLDRVLEHIHRLERPIHFAEPERVRRLEQSVRAIRTEPAGFGDDGPHQAKKALAYLVGLVHPEERRYLERCAACEPSRVPEWIVEGARFKEALLDRILQTIAPTAPRVDHTSNELLREVFDAVELRLAATREGAEGVVSRYALDLENDPEGVRDALRHYTVVLAATLNQSAGQEMMRVRGLEAGRTEFYSVIVDEAARAHPLDLFIPLSMARRRVVLVGDHRQLPHLLEPEVERELAEADGKQDVKEQTLDAIRASLFERLWVLLRDLEDKDGICRTVTLDTQYRMHPVLGGYVSRSFYETDGTRPVTIHSPRPAKEFAHTLPSYDKAERPCAAAWLDVPARRGREQSGISKRRESEAHAIAAEVHRLIEHDSSLTIGVITFYSAQVGAIGRAMLKNGLTERTGNDDWQIAARWRRTRDHGGREVERLRIGTVDAFQGMEFDVVFLSITRSNDLPGANDADRRRKYGHLMLNNRLCVAMSRQQRLLVAVGDLQFIRESPLDPLRAYAELCGGPDGVVLASN